MKDVSNECLWVHQVNFIARRNPKTNDSLGVAQTNPSAIQDSSSTSGLSCERVVLLFYLFNNGFVNKYNSSTFLLEGFWRP